MLFGGSAGQAWVRAFDPASPGAWMVGEVRRLPEPP